MEESSEKGVIIVTQKAVVRDYYPPCHFNIVEAIRAILLKCLGCEPTNSELEDNKDNHEPSDPQDSPSNTIGEATDPADDPSPTSGQQMQIFEDDANNVPRPSIISGSGTQTN
ncbi:hypothetical protein F0562_013101 [Nyssa sinensis]|uniref:Uncharacterized protein n=1 Tax=Nyssa sinensis TaxID=561372 RepID=A0A5J4ZXU6_9ASTE|nr:hypothetical protein F0562_013101 [Nyssa sinensis]